MSTTTRARVNSRSAARRRSRSGRALTRYRCLTTCTRRRTASSACVSRLRLPCTVFRVAAGGTRHAHGARLRALRSRLTEWRTHRWLSRSPAPPSPPDLPGDQARSEMASINRYPERWKDPSRLLPASALDCPAEGIPTKAPRPGHEHRWRATRHPSGGTVLRGR